MDMQETLAQVWAQVLGTPEVGPDDDFFVLGGDSITAIKAIVEAEKRGVTIDLVDLFERPTIRQLVSRGGHPAHPAPAAASAATGEQMTLPEGVEQAYPASLLQQGLIFEGMARDESLYHDVITRRITLPYDEGAMRAALGVLSARHESLRTSIDLTGHDTVLQLVAREAAIPLRSTDGSGRDPAALLGADLGHAGEPFDVERGPLIRVAVTTLAGGFQLTYGFHHAIMDGWSDTVFISELMACYQALSRGEEPPPAGPRPPVAEFVRRERAAVESTASRDFWLARTRDLPGVDEPDERSTLRHRVSVAVPGALQRRIVEFAAEHRVTVKSVLLAGHLAALQARDGSDVPVTGLVTNGRPEEAGGDEMIGLFLNVLPLAVPVSADGGDFVRRVRRAEQEIIPHRRFPYAEIKRLHGRHLYGATFNFVHFRLEQRLYAEGVMSPGSREIHDKVSFPLIIDAVREADGGALRLDLSADAAVWPAAELTKMAELHRAALERLVTGADHD